MLSSNTRETQLYAATPMDPIISTLRSILNDSDGHHNKASVMAFTINNNYNNRAPSPVSSFHDESSPPSSPQHQELFLPSAPSSSPEFFPVSRFEHPHQLHQLHHDRITGDESFLKLPTPRPPVPPLGSAPFPPSMRQRRPVVQSQTSAFNTGNAWRQNKKAKKLHIHNTNKRGFNNNNYNNNNSSSPHPPPLPPPSPFTNATNASASANTHSVSITSPSPSTGTHCANDKNSYIARSQFCYPSSSSNSVPAPPSPRSFPQIHTQTESVLPLNKYQISSNFCLPPSPPLPPSSSSSSSPSPSSPHSSSSSSSSPSSMSTASSLFHFEPVSETQSSKALFADSNYVSDIFHKIEQEGQLQTHIFPGYISPQQYPPNIRKRKRTERLCAGQTKVLELVFSRDPMPNKRTKELLAEELSISITRVQVWFQNRRAKQRKEYWNTQLSTN